MSGIFGKSMSKADKIKWIITLIGTLIVVLIPAGGLYTSAMKLFMIITVFSLFVIAFEFLPPLVMVVTMPVLYIISGVAPATAVMSPWLGETMLVCLGGFVFAAVLETSGLLTRIAYTLMAKVNGSYMALLVAIYLVGVILTFVTFGGAYIIMAALCAGLCISLGVMKTKMGAGVAMACMLGTCTAKTFTYPITMYAIIAGAAGDLAKDTLASMTLTGVLFHNSPLFFITLAMVIITAKWYKPENDIGSADFFKTELEKLGEITRDEIVAAILLVAMLTYMVSCSFTGMNMNWAFMLGPWLAFFPIINCADWETAKKINIDMIFFVAGCMAIGTVASTLGFSEILAKLMTAIFSGGNAFVTFGAVFAIVFVMNFLMTPMAIWALLTAPLMQVAIDLGLNQLPFLYCLLSCAEAIIFPYEYVPYLTVYAFGMMTMGDFIKLNTVRCAIFVAGFLGVLIPFWMLIGLI